MSAVLDMVGSFIIGGLLLLMILSVNANFNITSTEDRLELIVQENLTEIVEVLEYDFRKIGYGVTSAFTAITSIDTSAIAFWSDLDNDGTIDQVTYSLSLPNAVPGTMNPRDRILHRTVNGQTISSSLGITSIQMSYFDESGVVTTNPQMVRSIEYSITVESTIPIDSVYARSAWTGQVSPKNL